MRTAITPTVVFNPSLGTIDFTGFSGFDIRLLYSIVNVTEAAVLYQPGGTAGIKSIDGTGKILTLTCRTVNMSATDILMIEYEVAAGSGSGFGT